MTASVTVVVSLLAGSYPALFLSAFQPGSILKGAFRNTDKGKWIRQSLIVFQFSIAIFLIAATLIMQRQLYFIQHKNLGYDRNHILVLPLNEKVMDNLAALKMELSTGRDVIGVSVGRWTPVSIVSGYNMRSASMPESEQISVNANRIDEQYIRTAGMQIIAGSDFTEQDNKDVAGDGPEPKWYAFILNESAAARLGWTPDQAVGKKMFLDNTRPGYVKGVVRDFNFQSLHSAIKPLVLFPGLVGRGKVLVKINPLNVAATVNFVESKWKELVPDIPFDYRFMDDEYRQLYQSELQLGTVMNLFSGIAILLACLGLFGLSSYIGQQRIKEIGVRKILGASSWNITGLLSSSFAKPLLLSILLATPFAWWVMKQWLDKFNYRIDMQWWMFGISGLSAILIALATVAMESIRAAKANPVKSLRAE